ncbi:hypothetical protein GCM10022211_04990 [Sphingomonas humi]|uniref:Uncharacterized protein n=1 Tax=Sphingomonas humi TaxID=335630 RepID=A0ABP7RJD1_9SPHN
MAAPIIAAKRANSGTPSIAMARSCNPVIAGQACEKRRTIAPATAPPPAAARSEVIANRSKVAKGVATPETYHLVA